MICRPINSIKALILLFLIVLTNTTPLYGQITNYGDEPVVWPTGRPMDIPKEISNYSSSDLVIINERTEFYFYSMNNQKIKRSVLFKVNTAKGLSELQTFKLPESFDNAYDECLNAQGRMSKIDIPYISEYHIDKFAVRKAVSKVWIPVKFKYRADKLRWIRNSGEFANDNLNLFQLQDIEVGDIIEVYYESFFTANYGSNQFYFNGKTPKLNSEYNFIYKVDQRFADYSFVLPVNVNDSSIRRSAEEFKDHSIITYQINLKNLKSINYPMNSWIGGNLPHVYADFRYYTIVKGSYPTEGARMYEYDSYRPRNFEWVVFNDTLNNFTKVYDKQFAAVRKFISKMPPVTNDSTKLIFLKALCDTLNSYQYISSNDLYYNKSALYDLYSGDHLLKRRKIQHSIWKLTKDILNEDKIFYYFVNVIDNRFSEHSIKQRFHYSYENYLVATPYNKTFIYFMPGIDGVKYHLNELPFYNEGVIASMTARNFQDNAVNKESQVFKFIKTHSSNYKENTRTESATIKMSLDSLKSNVTIKESLAGQFSTILRHYYLNEYIDSTVSPYYFKKCTDKPMAKDVKIKMTSGNNEFPFRYNFNCTEKLSMASAKSINMSNWFSFFISQKVINETPNFDYYFDFVYTDSYTFLLDIDKNVEFANSDDFKRSIDNDYFSLESVILKNSESNYLVKVNYSVKQRKIPVSKANLISDMAKTLDELNSFNLQIKQP